MHEQHKPQFIKRKPFAIRFVTINPQRKSWSIPHALRLATFEGYSGTQLMGLGQEFMLHKPRKLNHKQERANWHITRRPDCILRNNTVAFRRLVNRRLLWWLMHARNLHRSCNLMQQSDHQAIVYVHQCHEINEMPVGGFQRPMPSMDKETDIEFITCL